LDEAAARLGKIHQQVVTTIKMSQFRRDFASRW